MLNRSDLVERLRKKKYTKKDSLVVVNDVIDTIIEILIEGESLHIRGFGKFEVKEFKEKEIIDIVTNEKIILPSYKAPKFTAGERLKKAVKEGFLRD